ncbi:3-dehydroquinate synthase [Magnetococcales bacterium HHB-1]
MAARQLSLDLGSKSYTIHIGSQLLAQLSDIIQQQFSPATQIAIISNETVAPLYLDAVQKPLINAGFSPLPVILPDGESYKNWPTLMKIFDTLIENRFERGSLLIALGGGVIGDMTGFAAASLLRGVPFIQIPTTLLAQVDASVGGKTGINHTLGKNLIGAFYQPKSVLIDCDTLKTLPQRELVAGLAEVIKYGIIWDKDLFALLEEKIDDLLALDEATLTEVIYQCCAIKADVVAQDEREKGVRALLNLGHTFGHAIETLTNYNTFLHGEAVGAGMIIAAELSYRLERISKAENQRIYQLIERTGLPTTIPKFSTTDYFAAMSRDKKVAQGKIRYILVDRIGEASLHQGLSETLISQVLKHFMQ